MRAIDQLSRLRSGRRKQRGVAAVEFALVAFVFFLLFFGIAAVGFLLARLDEELDDFDDTVDADALLAAMAGTPMAGTAQQLVDEGVIGLDDTIERRWGTKIKARGIYRDPVRSSHGHFVKASGLRWLCVMLLAPIPWAGCVWALPFLTILAPSERYAQKQGRRHKKLTDWGRQALLQTAR